MTCSVRCSLPFQLYVPHCLACHLMPCVHVRALLLLLLLLLLQVDVYKHTEVECSEARSCARPAGQPTCARWVALP
jgi:hypothetical protein